ncbi:MAG: GlsB/YeaQ/YmgE family stress response membrane protein [Chloroflexota bacterium]
MQALLVILVILAIVALFGLWQIVGSVVGLIITVIVAAIIGWLADLVVPGNTPYGFLGAALAGVLGSWLGVALLGRIGPDVSGFPLISAIIGAIIVTAIFALLTSQRMFRRP